MSDAFDSVVIGGGISGLVAAAYLAKAGKRVLLLEASNTLGGLCQPADLGDGFLSPHVAHALYALDPRILKDFRSVRRGLAFAGRDLPLAGLSEDGKHVLLNRDVHATARSIAVHSAADAAAWPKFRSELFSLARAMRKLWWRDTRFEPARLSRSQQQLLATLRTTSAVAWLDSWFESDVLKAALAFEAVASGGSLLEPGSALTLAWRGAQEMCGLQGAVAIPRRTAGVLAKLLADAATNAGAVIRTSARVERLLVETDGIAGVELGFRETIACRSVFSTLTRRDTLLGYAADAVPFAEAEALRAPHRTAGAALVSIALDDTPHVAGGALPLNARFVLADRLESYVAADAAARAGQLPSDLVFEAIVASASDDSVAPPGRHMVSCLVRPLPLAPEEGWNALKAKLTAKVVAMLDRHSPGLVPRVISIYAATPDMLADENEAASAERMLMPWSARVRTSIRGLYLCGAGAEPVGAVSGRAARLAVAIASGDGR
jgi:phytoene dehydrogenase-like protein